MLNVVAPMPRLPVFYDNKWSVFKGSVFSGLFYCLNRRHDIDNQDIFIPSKVIQLFFKYRYTATQKHRHTATQAHRHSDTHPTKHIQTFKISMPFFDTFHFTTFVLLPPFAIKQVRKLVKFLNNRSQA